MCVCVCVEDTCVLSASCSPLTSSTWASVCVRGRAFCCLFAAVRHENTN